MEIRLIAGIIVLLIGAGVLYVMMPDNGRQTVRVDHTDAQAVALGGEIYKAECASCHGADRAGQVGWDTLSTKENPLAPPHDGSGHTWQHPDEALFDLTKFGISTIACRTLDTDSMPKFEDVLNDRQIVAVLAYIKSGWSEDILAQNRDINALYGYQ